MKSSRRRSPVQSRKHGERGEKSGGGGGSSSSGTSFLGTPNAGTAVGSNTHLSPAASNLTLPATPSTQSLFSASEDRNHANPMSALPNLTASLDASTASSATALVKAADELLDDDPVLKLFLISFSYQFPIFDRIFSFFLEILSRMFHISHLVVMEPIYYWTKWMGLAEAFRYLPGLRNSTKFVWKWSIFM